MSDEPEKKPIPKNVKRGIALGVVLAIICTQLPPEHRDICNLLASIGRGGL